MTVRGKRSVAIQVYGRGEPVLLVHGWGGSGQQMAGFVDLLVARGYSAVTVDLPAHGASEGQQTDVVECSDALLAVARRFGEPQGVVAHSFGAAAAALAVQRGLATGALVFVAPLPSMDHGLHHFARLARLPLPVMDRAARLIESDLGLPRALIDLTQIGPEMRVPLLCIHDREDSITPIDATREVVKAWPGARLLETSGLGHRRILQDRDVVGHAVAFLSQGHRERPVDLDRVLTAAAAQ